MSDRMPDKPRHSVNGHVQPDKGEDLPGAGGCGMWLFIAALTMLAMGWGPSLTRYATGAP